MSNHQKPCVLIVDDEVDARLTLRNFLEERYSCEFAEAKDGEEALHYLKTNPCQFVLLDIRMPKKNGINVIKEVKEIDSNIDILLVSAWINEEMAEEAAKLGVTEYVSKPIDLNTIASKFEEVFRKKGIEIKRRQL
jgi:YesN/AraC family two-component response regulator